MKQTLVNQPTSQTTRKVSAASWTAAWVAPASTIAAAYAVKYLPATASSLETEFMLLASFIVTGVGTWIAGYWTRERA